MGEMYSGRTESALNGLPKLIRWGLGINSPDVQVYVQLTNFKFGPGGWP